MFAHGKERCHFSKQLSLLNQQIHWNEHALQICCNWHLFSIPQSHLKQRRLHECPQTAFSLQSVGPLKTASNARVRKQRNKFVESKDACVRNLHWWMKPRVGMIHSKFYTSVRKWRACETPRMQLCLLWPFCPSALSNLGDCHSQILVSSYVAPASSYRRCYSQRLASMNRRKCCTSVCKSHIFNLRICWWTKND